MPAQRLSMRKKREVLHPALGQGLSKRKTAHCCSVRHPPLDEYLRRAEVAGLTWPLPMVLDDGELDRRLFPPVPNLIAATLYEERSEGAESSGGAEVWLVRGREEVL